MCYGENIVVKGVGSIRGGEGGMFGGCLGRYWSRDLE